MSAEKAMQAPIEPRESFDRIHLKNADVISAGLMHMYDHVRRVHVRSASEDAHNVVERLSFERATLRRFDESGFGFRATSRDLVTLGFTTKGGLRIGAGGDQVETKPYEIGDSIAAGQSFSLDAAPNSIFYTLTVPVVDITAHAEALFGHPQYRGPDKLRVDLRGGAGAAYVRNMLHVFREFEALRPTGISLIGLASFEEHLLNLFIAATRPDLVGFQNREPSFAPAIVQRAQEYFTAHAAQPVRIAEAAAEMGISVRALQMAFKRHVGCSPLEYLLTCRLGVARARLLAARPHESVTSIAMQCGFINLGAFAQRYRAAYGDLPSHTLRRALMRR